MNQPNTLKGIRAQLLGYRERYVADALGIPLDRLSRIESGSLEPSVLELERMADLYGLPAEMLADDPVKLSPGDGVEVLTSLDEFRELGDTARHKIVRAASAARDLTQLAKLQGEDRRIEFAREAPQQQPGRDSPHRQGRAIARELRSRLGIGTGPIGSLRDLMSDRYPSLSILYADLGPYGPAGLSFADHLRGPAIVLNLRGKNENAQVRRFSLAHELCHLLVDWNRRQPLATVSGYFCESGLEREQRANAFAVRFLLPEGVLRTCMDAGDWKTLSAYGLPNRALQLYVQNEAGGKELPRLLPERQDWEQAERPVGLDPFPLAEVPTERRTHVASLAARLHSRGAIARDMFAEYLRVGVSLDLERVLDFFALDPPVVSASCA